MINIDLLKKLREETQAGIADIKEALVQAKGDQRKAKEILQKKGLDKAAKKADRETQSGVVEAYIHNNKNSGAMVILTCETDFVARNEEFIKLAHEIAMQVTAMDPKDVKSLSAMFWIKDEKITIADLVKSQIAKFGENIKIFEFKRFTLEKVRT